LINDNKLFLVLNKINDHNYVLNSGGTEINGKKYKYAAGAAEVHKIITQALNSKNPDPQKIYAEIVKTLSSKTQITSGFFGWGARDLTTANLYKDILKIIKEEEDTLKIKPDIRNSF
jgi:hypothetical protein